LDIKSKKSKGMIIWLCFFIGVNIVGFIASGSIVEIINSGYTDTIDSIRDVYKTDIKDTRQFKHTITLMFNMLAKSLTDDNYSSMIEAMGEDLNKEEENLIFYAENFKTGKRIANSKTDLGISVKGFPSLLQGYDYYFYYNGEEFFAGNSDKPQNIDKKDIGYSNLYHWGCFSENINSKFPGIRDCRILLVVKKDITKVISETSRLYNLKKRFQVMKWTIIGIIVVFLFGVALLIISILNRKLKHEFDFRLAKLSGKLWFEPKALVSLFVIAVIMEAERNTSKLMYSTQLRFAFFLIIAGWWFYLMFIDLVTNKRRFFSNNSINMIIRKYRSFEGKKPFQKGMILRLFMFIGAEAILVFLAGAFCIIIIQRMDSFFFYCIFIVAAIGVYLIYRYQRRYSNTITDIGRLVDQIEAIKAGGVTDELVLDPDTDMYNAAKNLNSIKEGMNKVIEEKVKSERTKVELITNVSHDLKTPLTSIISYVDLLSKEQGLPEHVNDYVKILIQKSNRLKTLIEDLFDLTRASSGEIKVDYERLDLGKLIKQTMADLNEEISRSELAFRVNIPEQPVFILSDGKKLYRVFLNLISNALKYSLPGSRVYIDLIVQNMNNKTNGETKEIDYEVVVIIKNTANYEMSFSQEEILERFVRGDKARSTEGSGLGLAIAKNFTQVCGGKFDIVLDGDLFKVILSFAAAK